MEANKSTGEFSLSFNNKEYIFKPSFKNIAKIGTPTDIVNVYSVLFGKEVTFLLNESLKANKDVQAYALNIAFSPVLGRKVLSCALTILNACNDSDLSGIFGYYKPSNKGIVYRIGAVNTKDVIALSKHLALHGIIGNIDLKTKENKRSEYTSEFDVEEYISAARCHFGLSRADAENLTMTEFQMLIKSKYPEQQKKSTLFTEEEYDQIMEDYYKNREQTLKNN
ncbi:DUF6246 family protein [Pasteurella multocida]